MNDLETVQAQLAEAETQLKLALNRERIWRECIAELLSARRNQINPLSRPRGSME
jgi:hypothetical protein